MTEPDGAFVVTVHEEEDGSLWAEVDDLPGCFATGDDFDELWENVAEAIGLYLSQDDHHVAITTTSVTELAPANRKFELATS